MINRGRAGYVAAKRCVKYHLAIHGGQYLRNTFHGQGGRHLAALAAAKNIDEVNHSKPIRDRILMTRISCSSEPKWYTAAVR